MKKRTPFVWRGRCRNPVTGVVKVYDGDFGTVQTPKTFTEATFNDLLKLIWKNPVRATVVRNGRRRKVLLYPEVRGCGVVLHTKKPKRRRRAKP